MALLASKSSRRTPINQRRGFWVAVLLVVLLIAGYEYSKTWKSRKAQTPPAAVVTAVATQTDVPVYLFALGGVVPTYSVTIMAQVDGQLLNVYYKEGQEVKKGDLLAQIDPAPYQALLTQYQGALIRDEALLRNARIDLTRYQTLWKQDSVSQQTLQTQVALVQQYEAAVMIDKGLIQSAQVSLGYCRITSPINGRVGLRLVDPGNIVQTTSTTGLLIINTLNPITVVFSIPEDNIPDVMQKFTADKGLLVKAYDRQQTHLLAEGKLLTVDNQVDTTTGTVKLKAQFKNDKALLFPNQFVNIQILIKTLKNVTIVPTGAIQYSTSGSFVYVVNDKKTVTISKVKAGITSGNNTVVLTGVKPGEAVVTEGADKLSNGMKVTVQKDSDSPAKV